MRLKSALRRGVAAAVIAGIVVSSGIPAYAARWNIADGDITVEGASDESGNYNNVKQGEKDFEKDEGETVITGESDKNTVTIDTSEGNVDVTFDDLKIDVSGKKEGDGSDDSPVDAGKAAVTVQGDHDAAIELDGANELKSGSHNAGLEKNGHESSGKLTIKDDNDTKGSLTAKGGEGGLALAEEVVRLCDEPNHFQFVYDVNDSIEDKLNAIATKVYHADGVVIAASAKKQLKQLTELGFDKLPICMAKTQFSFSDDASKLGAPRGFKITVRDLKVNAGAGFLVAKTGDIMTMPGLPKVPSAEKIDVDENGKITGLF